MRYILGAAVSAMALAAMSAGAVAQTSATATTDLNMRAGPGPNHEVVSVIPADRGVAVLGCIEGSQWCQVDFDGTRGWAFSQYLTADYSGERVVISERREVVGIPPVAYDPPAGMTTGSTVGAVGGAIAGSLIAGPIGAIAGGIAGATAGGAAGVVIDPPPPVRTYVRDNRYDPIYLDGEVVIGAGIPQNVELRTIPDYDYRYAYVNGLPVIVDPGSRRIVYVVR